MVKYMIGKFKEFTPEIHHTAYIAPNATVIGMVKLGQNTSVWYNTVLRGDIEYIIVEDNTNIQDGSVLHCEYGVALKVGKGVTIGHGAILHSCDIGDNCLIGMGAIVLNNAIIGKNSLVGAGAVVTPGTVIPEGSMVLGSPAKVKRSLSEEEIENIRKSAEGYVTRARYYLTAE